MFWKDQLEKDNLHIFSGDKYFLVCPKCWEMFADRDPKIMQNIDEPAFMRTRKHKCHGEVRILEEFKIDEYLAKYHYR